MKKCIKCGAELGDNAKFCGECGTKQEVIAKQTEESRALISIRKESAADEAEKQENVIEATETVQVTEDSSAKISGEHKISEQSEEMKLLYANMKQKNMAVAIALALFFGPLGLIYADVKLGLILTVIAIVLAVIISLLTALTFGIGSILFLAFIPFDIFCAYMAYRKVEEHNEKLIQEVMN